MIGVAVAFRNAPDAQAAVYLGAEGILFYLVAYALMTLGAFGVIIALSTPERPVETVDDLAGLGRTHPWTALAMALCLFSLAGIPPLAGFYGKFQLLFSAFGATTGPNARLSPVAGRDRRAELGDRGLLLPPDRRDDVPPPRLRRRSSRAAAWPTTLAVGACAILSLLVGLLPAPVSRAAHDAAIASMHHPDPTPALPVAMTAAH